MKHGGSRVGAGRKARTTPKSKPIWCGQVSEEDRAFIMKWLEPDERFQVLLKAANKACSGRAFDVGGVMGFQTNYQPETENLPKHARR